MNTQKRIERFQAERAAIARQEAANEAERHEAAVRALEAWARDETPDGRPMSAFAAADANLLWRQERARNSWRYGPPPDLASRRFR